MHREQGLHAHVFRVGQYLNTIIFEYTCVFVNVFINVFINTSIFIYLNTPKYCDLNSIPPTPALQQQQK